MSKSRFAKFKPSAQNPVAGGIFVALFAAIGVYLLIGTHAASPTILTSAGNGSVGCNASIQHDVQGSSYVKFGSGTSCNTGGGGGGGGILGSGANMFVAINEGTGHGTTGAQQAAELGGFDRLDATSGNTSLIASTVKTFSDNKVRVDLLIGSGSADNWVNFYKTVCLAGGLQANECPTVEIENEPDLNGVSPQTYAATLEADYKAFHNTLGSSSPAVVGAYEGGSTSSFTFGETWFNYNPDTNQNSTGYMKNYTDAIYEHPYGHHVNTSVCSSPFNTFTLSGAPCSVIDSALGDRGAVIKSHADTGKPVLITEVGWPTDNGGSNVPTTYHATGDSYQWPLINCSNTPNGSSCSGGGPNQGDQCNNVYNIITWSRTQNYIYGVTYFGINDYGSGYTSYGVLDGSGNKKPAYYAMVAAAKNQANPCPNPLRY
jgi:hypothetical protein